MICCFKHDIHSFSLHVVACSERPSSFCFILVTFLVEKSSACKVFLLEDFLRDLCQSLSIYFHLRVLFKASSMDDPMLNRSLPALQIGILQDTENGCDVVFVLFFRLPPNLDSGLTS